MRKHRFFTADPLALNTSISLNVDLSHQVSRVLRLQINDIIYIFNNTGYEYTAQIQTINRNTVDVQLTRATADAQESPLRINLAQVIAKGEKMELVIQKATELGVNTITPLYSERSVAKKIQQKAEHKIDHWQKIAIAASCQSWRNYVPVVTEAQSIVTWLKRETEDYKLILSTSGTSTRLKDLKLSSSISILIGPEGGFSDEELELALEHNFQAISLGPRILRTETAGLATIAILQSMIGDV